jgi:hypothetical protein
MTGLQKVLKTYGEMKVNGVLWVWDYVNGKPRIKSEMTKEEFVASEKLKWTGKKTV